MPHTDKYYEAKVLKSEYRGQGGWYYFLHYNGWNKKYDEWVEAVGLVKGDQAAAVGALVRALLIIMVHEHTHIHKHTHTHTTYTCTYTHTESWPEPNIFVYTKFLAGKPPNVRSYVIYGAYLRFWPTLLVHAHPNAHTR